MKARPKVHTFCGLQLLNVFFCLLISNINSSDDEILSLSVQYKNVGMCYMIPKYLALHGAKV